MRKDHTLATKVHSYRRANDPTALDRAVAEVFAEIAGTTADAAQVETFEQLAPIPGEIAAVMIQALSGAGNHPIGTRPAPAAADTTSKPQVSGTAGAPTANPPAAAPPASQPPLPVASSSRKRIPFWVIVAGLVALTFLSRVMKRTRG